MTAGAMDEAGGTGGGGQEASAEELRRLLAAAEARESALADVLSIINISPGDPRLVFDAILENAMRLCEVAFGLFYRVVGENFELVTHRGVPAEFAAHRAAHPPARQTSIAARKILETKQPVHILDRQDTETYPAVDTSVAGLGGARTLLVVPLLKDGVVLGIISVYRREVRAFSDKDISLLEGFAAQAVIAMENARHLTEQRERQRELEEALESQTATAEILDVIARSPTDSQPVFETIARNVRRLTDALHSAVYTYDGDLIHLIAFDGAYGAEGVDALMRAFPQKPGGIGATTRAVATGEVHYIPDVQADPDYAVSYVARAANYRSVVSVPMLRDGRPVGAITAATARVAAFSERKITLLKTFAEQAAIALAGAENYQALQERGAELARAVTEQREALERQTATAEVLQVINASSSDLVPVFDAILEKGLRLADAAFGAVFIYEGETMQAAATRGMTPALAEFRATNPVLRIPPQSLRMAETKRSYQLRDVREGEAYLLGLPGARAVAELGGARTILFVPLLREGGLIGTIQIYRQEVREFSDKQITLLESFAAQAVIAIENARLITEQREALERQTATSEILGVINSSLGNVGPVFDIMLQNAMRLCDATCGGLFALDETGFQTLATRDVPKAFAEFRMQNPPTTLDSRVVPLLATRKPVHVLDIADTDGYRREDPGDRAIVDLGGARTILNVPLLKHGDVVGYISVYRSVVRAFTDRQIALLESFATQAVIAMENARLISEQREALEQQTATAEVLGVINASPGNLAPVFDAMLDKAMRLCEAAFGTLYLAEGLEFSFQAARGLPPAYAEFRKEHLRAVAPPGSPPWVVKESKRPLQIPDLMADQAHRDGYEGARALVDLGGARTVLYVPLLQDAEVRGIFVVYRQEVRAFSDRQIALLENFASQAVIAMENARLLDELRQRTEALALRNTEFGERIEQQSATIDVLKVMSASPGDPQPVFDLIAHRAREFCGADSGGVLEYDGSLLHLRAIDASPEDIATAHAAFPRPAKRDSTAGRAILTAAPAHIAEIAADPDYRKERDPDTAAMLTVPMLREGAPIGVVAIGRSTPGYFTEVQIELLKTFAEQAVIAITSAETYHALRHARDAAEASLADLRRAQDRLVQSEKMASLGQLTAGIAHEIKNPLNFVNNFSDLSADLIDELHEVLAPVERGVDAARRTEIEELTATLKGNLAKIAEHGRRADSIVKNMLEHSRTGASERRAVDLNAVAEEALNLAYHGARAEIPGFNITLEKKLDPGIGSVEVYPQELARVLVNLVNNGFYAARKRAEASSAGFEPTLSLETRDLGGQVGIRVRDNGTGIPADVREKIFEPFFTTKPAGQGTGLGLSLSYDIVVKQHGGQLGVESEPGVFTEFTITLPRAPSG